MRLRLKNWLLPNNRSILSPLKQKTLLCLLFFVFTLQGQIINYVNNGGFENLNPGAAAYSWDAAKYWGPIDTNRIASYLCSTKPAIGNAPYVSTGFQYPRTGESFIGVQFFCGGAVCNANNSRFYPRNRLKQILKPNTAYCAKYFIVNTNNNNIAIDRFEMFFGDPTLDTIKYCNNNLTYLIAQVTNTLGIITDTLNWVPITGTFTAAGNEKYVVLGNFKSNPTTNTLQINGPSPISADIYLDDVSLIELNLPAFAGRDTFFVAGDSIYLGRESDVGIDEACIWYKLPGTTPIDTVAGFWAKPVATSTYVVKQEICGMVKWDTVILNQSAIGINEIDFYSQNIKLYPQPAQDFLKIEFTLSKGIDFKKAIIFNNLGQMVREEEITFTNNSSSINLNNLANGVYSISLTSSKGLCVSRRFVIAR